jgi:hypothetical protein
VRKPWTELLSARGGDNQKRPPTWGKATSRSPSDVFPTSRALAAIRRLHVRTWIRGNSFTNSVRKQFRSLARGVGRYKRAGAISRTIFVKSSSDQPKRVHAGACEDSKTNAVQRKLRSGGPCALAQWA